MRSSGLTRAHGAASRRGARRTAARSRRSRQAAASLTRATASALAPAPSSPRRAHHPKIPRLPLAAHQFCPQGSEPGESRYAVAHDTQAADHRAWLRPSSRSRFSSRSATLGAARLRTAGERQRLHPEAAGQGEAAYGGRSPAARRRSRPRHAAQRRQRDRRRQSPRRWCSIWSSRNPRASAAAPSSSIGTSRRTARRHRRARDCALGGYSRALPRCRRQAAPPDVAMASGLSVGAPGVLAALKLAHDKFGKLPMGRAVPAGNRRSPATVSPSRPALPSSSPRSTPAASRRRRAPISSTRDGKPWPAGYN